MASVASTMAGSGRWPMVMEWGPLKMAARIRALDHGFGPDGSPGQEGYWQGPSSGSFLAMA